YGPNLPQRRRDAEPIQPLAPCLRASAANWDSTRSRNRSRSRPKSWECPMNRLSVGGLIFPGFELLDIFGPLELFGMLGDRASLTMLAEKPGACPSYQGPKAVAEMTLAESGSLDVLLVPGGYGTRPLAEDAAFLADLRA